MTPNEAVLGSPFHSTCDSFSVETVNAILSDRTRVIRTLRDNLFRAQIRIKNFTGAIRTDVSFQMGD